MQADIEWRGDDGIESFAKHAVAVGADHIVADPHTLRAVDALVGIAQDEAVRHVKFIVVIIARLAIVEAVIGQSMLDTVLLQITLTGCRTRALQATSRFALGLFFQIAQLDQREAAFALLIRQHWHFDLRLDRLIRNNVEQVGFALFQFKAVGRCFHIFAAEKGINGPSAEFALGNTFDNGLRAHLRVTTGKDGVAVGHVVMRIRLDGVPFRPLDTRLLVKHAGIDSLTNGRDDGITFDGKL